MQITGLLLKAKIGRYLMRNGGGLDANIHSVMYGKSNQTRSVPSGFKISCL